MKHTKKIFALLLLLALVSIPATTSAGGRKMGEMPAPRLMAPSDVVDLTGKDTLEFRWGTEGGNYDGFDFRLYKGSQTYEKGLILKKDIPRNENSVSIEASTFEKGQTYAWSLRFTGSKKSRSAYSVFKIT